MRAIFNNGGVPDPNANAISGAFNASLVEQLALNFGGILNYEFVDTYFLLQNVVASPGAFGYTNVDTPCFDGLSVCANPDEYFFWDEIHPTAFTHELIAAQVQVVPVPAAVWLFASTLGLLGWSRRRTA